MHDKAAPDSAFAPMLDLIKDATDDDRNFVKKAVNWALRQIGKRNRALNRRAIAIAEELRRMDSRAARWIAADALRELRSEAVQARLRRMR
jgi:3-methyladenine DNA glycosylase AlkD